MEFRYKLRVQSLITIYTSNVVPCALDCVCRTATARSSSTFRYESHEHLDIHMHSPSVSQARLGAGRFPPARFDSSLSPARPALCAS
jgi:hypothetical protein